MCTKTPSPSPMSAMHRVHLSCHLYMAMTYVPVVGFFAPDGLALRATQLIKNGGASAPIGVFPAMREQLDDLLQRRLSSSPPPHQSSGTFCFQRSSWHRSIKACSSDVYRVRKSGNSSSKCFNPWLSIIPTFASSPAHGPLLGHDC